MSKFAVFVTGTYANRFDLNDAQAIAGGTGTALGHPLFDNSTQSVGPGTNVLQAAIDARFAAGGGTVVMSAGTYTQNVHLILKNNVRLKGAGEGSTTLNITGGVTMGTGAKATGVPTLVGLTFPTTMNAGNSSFAITNSLAADAIIIPVATDSLGQLYIIGSQAIPDDFVHRADSLAFIPLPARRSIPKADCISAIQLAIVKSCGASIPF